MVTATLAASAALAFLASGVYLLVGQRLARRTVSDDARRAARLFMLWWFALALSAALGGLQSALGSVGFAPLPLFLGLLHLNVVLVCAGLAGLMYYLTFLFTGRKGLFWPIALFYVATAVLFLAHVNASGPMGVVLNRWNTTLDYARPFQGPLYAVLVGLLVFPPMLGALAYFSLYFRIKDRTLRYRIAVVSWAILVWFGTSFVAAAGGLAQHDAWQLASRLLGLAAALSILMAYEPPAVIKRRLGVTSISDQAALPTTQT